jgi:hypothetical protein
MDSERIWDCRKRKWKREEDRIEGKGRESGKIIYNTEVYIMKNDGFGMMMGLKRRGRGG